MSWDDYPFWYGRRRRRPFFFPSFGRDFFGDFDRTRREMDTLMEDAFKDLETKVPKNLIREKKLPDGSVVREMGPFVYGYSVSVGPDGKLKVREFGNLRPTHKPGQTRPKLDIQGEREPLIDVMASDEEVRVVAELPGVEKSDIKLNVTEDNLSISVEAPSRKFRKELDLPQKVDPDSTKASYKNGVLEVVIEVQQKKKQEGKSVSVD